jgi:hypothetical protein
MEEKQEEEKQEEWNDINLNKIVDVDYEESDKSVGIFQGCFCIVGIDDKGKQQQIFLSDDVMVNLFDKLEKYFKGYLAQQESYKEEHEGIA